MLIIIIIIIFDYIQTHYLMLKVKKKKSDNPECEITVVCTLDPFPEEVVGSPCVHDTLCDLTPQVQH